MELLWQWQQCSLIYAYNIIYLSCCTSTRLRIFLIWLACPRFSLQWLKEIQTRGDGSYVEMGGKIYKLIKNETTLVETEEGAYLNKLIIPSVKGDDAGVYMCVGINHGGGSDIRKAQLRVINQPGRNCTRLNYCLSNSHISSSSKVWILNNILISDRRYAHRKCGWGILEIQGAKTFTNNYAESGQRAGCAPQVLVRVRC